MNCASAGRALSEARKKRTGKIPVLENDLATRASPLTSRRRRLAARRHAVSQPRSGDDEERRQEKAKQGIQPDQRDIEAAEAEADPQCSQRTMSFQAIAPESGNATRVV